MIFKLRSPVWFAAEMSRALYARLRGFALLADVDVEEKRLETCFSCPELDEESEQCTVCTCFVRAKAMIAVSKCPKKKWGPVYLKKR